MANNKTEILPLDFIDEIKLDALLWKPIDVAKVVLFVKVTRVLLVGRLVLNLDEAVVDESSRKQGVQNLGFLWSPNLVGPRATFEGTGGDDRLGRGADGFQLLIDVVGTHPVVPWSAIGESGRRICQGRVQTVQVPMQIAIITRNDFLLIE